MTPYIERRMQTHDASAQLYISSLRELHSSLSLRSINYIQRQFLSDSIPKNDCTYATACSSDIHLSVIHDTNTITNHEKHDNKGFNVHETSK